MNSEGRSLTVPILRQRCGGDQRKATRLPLEGLALEDLEALRLLPRPALVRELLVSRNALRGLEEVRALSGLKRLLAASNRLESVAGLEGCGELEELDLSDNVAPQLRLTPLAGLARLRVLSLAGIPEPAVPRALLGRGTLVRLSLARCGLAALPPLAPLRLLQQLDVSDNALSSLSGAGGLPQLTVLRAARNALRDARVEAVPRLQELDVRGNVLLESVMEQQGLAVLRDSPEQQAEEKAADKEAQKSAKKGSKKEKKAKRAKKAKPEGRKKSGKKRKVVVDEEVVVRALGAEEAVEGW
jgi:protein phosphatase 1 regulatory subunit 7